LFYLEHFSSPTTLKEEIGGKGARAQRVEHHKPTEPSLPLPVCTCVLCVLVHLACVHLQVLCVLVHLGPVCTYR